MSYEARIRELGLVLPSLPAAAGNFVDAVEAGGLLFSSGKGSRSLDGAPIVGKVGADVDVDQAYDHARTIGLYLISAWREALNGDLDRIKRVVKVLGFVNAAPDFTAHPKVINGCSDLFIDVFGEAGRHARSALGAGSLPNNITVEIETIVELK